MELFDCNFCKMSPIILIALEDIYLSDMLLKKFNCFLVNTFNCLKTQMESDFYTNQSKLVYVKM